MVPVANSVPFLVHENDGDTDSSMSLAVAEHINVSSLTTEELGEIDTLLSVGPVLDTTTLALWVLLSPPESVAVAVQTMVSPTSLSADDTV